MHDYDTHVKRSHATRAVRRRRGDVSWLQGAAGNAAVAALLRSAATGDAGARASAPVQRAVYLGTASTAPLAWATVKEDERKELAEASQLSANLVKRVYFDSGYHRFADWDAFVAYLKARPPEADRRKGFEVFAKRDKAYGLNKPREKHTVEARTGHPTIDSINNKLGLGMGRIARLAVLDDEEVREYARWLYFHPRYGPSEARRSAGRDRERGVGHGLEAELIKKSCKAAVSYTTQVQQCTVHFELEGIDMGAVVSKRDAGGWGITGAELRYIYRQTARAAQDNEVDLRRVKFYLRGVQVDAPWDTEPDLWAQYVPKDPGRRRPPPPVSLASPDDYGAMKDNATRPGRHKMLSRKKYKKLAGKFDKALSKGGWDTATGILDTIRPRLIEMRDAGPDYWRSEELKAQYFQPILARAEELRGLL